MDILVFLEGVVISFLFKEKAKKNRFKSCNFRHTNKNKIMGSGKPQCYTSTTIYLISAAVWKTATKYNRHFN